MATTIILPPHTLLESAAADLTRAAAVANDTKRQITLNKGLYDLLMGAETIAVAGGFLLPSASRAGLVHRFDNATGACTCEAGQHGRACRHAASIEIVERAQMLVMPAMGRRVVSREQALAEMDELFA